MILILLEIYKLLVELIEWGFYLKNIIIKIL